jgi:hypothetical protein
MVARSGLNLDWGGATAGVLDAACTVGCPLQASPARVPPKSPGFGEPFLTAQQFSSDLHDFEMHEGPSLVIRGVGGLAVSSAIG